MSATTSNSKGSKKRGRKDSQPVDGDQNVLYILQKHCTNDELGYLEVRQETLQEVQDVTNHENGPLVYCVSLEWCVHHYGDVEAVHATQCGCLRSFVVLWLPVATLGKSALSWKHAYGKSQLPIMVTRDLANW